MVAQISCFANNDSFVMSSQIASEFNFMNIHSVVRLPFGLRSCRDTDIGSMFEVGLPGSGQLGNTVGLLNLVVLKIRQDYRHLT